jgi:cell division protein FtsB
MDIRRQGWARIVAVVILTLAVLYILRLTGLILTTRRAEQIESGISSEVAALQQDVQALQTVSTTMGSDAYVEQWARDKQHMVRPGDHPVVPVAAPIAPGAPGNPVSRGGNNPGWWERFKRWLAGQ